HVSEDVRDRPSAAHRVEGVGKVRVGGVDLADVRERVRRERLVEAHQGVDPGAAVDVRGGIVAAGRRAHSPVTLRTSGKYSRRGSQRSSRSTMVKRRGKWISKAPRAKPATIASAACAGVCSAGMWKSLAAVSGVATKPGLMRNTDSPRGARSRCRVSAKLASAAFDGPYTVAFGSPPYAATLPTSAIAP